MKHNPANFHPLAMALTLGLMAFHLGCSSSTDTTADPAGQASSSPAATSDASNADPEVIAVPTMPTEGSVAKLASDEQVAAEPGAIVVPEGTPEQLFEFLDGLKTRQPAARDPESVKAFMGQLGQAVLTASDRILAAKPTEEQANEAVQYKLTGLSLLEQTGDTSVAAKRAAMPAELEAAGFGSSLRLVELDELGNRFQKLGMASKEEAATLSEDLAKFFEKTTPEPQEAILAMQAAGALERVLEPEQVAVVYERFGKVFSGMDDEQAAEIGAMMAGSARRMQLMGNEMPLDGLTVDGKEFQWDEYRGKVVLVDFWATWCGPCIQEMANIRENYDKYHERGFDVVGISIDESRSDLVSYLKDADLPWTVLVDEDLKRADREAMSTRYGIFGIPNVTLVGKDGKVVAVNPRGPELGEKLAEILGKEEAATPLLMPPAETPKTPPAETPKAPSAETPKDPPAEKTADPKPEGS